MRSDRGKQTLLALHTLSPGNHQLEGSYRVEPSVVFVKRQRRRWDDNIRGIGRTGSFFIDLQIPALGWRDPNILGFTALQMLTAALQTSVFEGGRA